MNDAKEQPFLDDPEAVELEDEDLGGTENGEADRSTDGAAIAELSSERDELRDRLMRALAEAENIRKRSARDRREAEAYGATRLARDLLPVYDNLERALMAVGEADQAIREGIELTQRELLSVFERHGISRVAPVLGSKFDPQLHQAMFEAPVPGSKAGDVIEVLAVGFLLHDRLLRPAQVGVSSLAG
jgi:molecular chaperone GrpE